jgi:competence protein ComEC
MGVVYVSPTMFEEKSSALNVLRQSLEDADVPIELTFAGDRLKTGGHTEIEVLHPPSTGVGGSDNANSIVLAVEHAGRRVLITGDLEAEGLRGLLEEMPLDVDILLAPHHGSTNSDPAGLVRWSTPEHVVITGGRNDRSPTVQRTYESQGGRVLHTANCGAISMVLSRERIGVEPFLNSADPSAEIARRPADPITHR